jgi:exosortase A-associated hydrolase 2
MAAAPSMTPFMLRDGVQGHRFCIHHAPAGVARAVVLHAHALAHEMHFARPTSARAARALAAAGFAVLQIDMFGCGDSSGEFEEASFETWQQDLRAGAAWLQAQHPGRPLWVWAERAASLWALGSLSPSPEAYLLWHPVLDGELALRQLLRTELPAALERGSNAKQVRESATASWARGEAFSLGGFRVSASLAAALTSRKLAPQDFVTRSGTGPVLRLDGGTASAWPVETSGSCGSAHGRAVPGPLPWLDTVAPDDWVTMTLEAASQIGHDDGPT